MLKTQDVAFPEKEREEERKYWNNRSLYLHRDIWSWSNSSCDQSFQSLSKRAKRVTTLLFSERQPLKSERVEDLWSKLTMKSLAMIRSGWEITHNCRTVYFQWDSLSLPKITVWRFLGGWLHRHDTFLLLTELSISEISNLMIAQPLVWREISL
jgi:hypothetical protein